MEPFDELQWTMEFFDNSVDLNIDGIDRVRNFVFMWNIFETFACNKYANIPAIEQAVEQIDSKQPILAVTFEPYVIYFSTRYFNPNGYTTYSIEGLNFRAGATDQAAKAKVEAVLNRQETTPKEILKALLFILYRFRNNLFHGNKQVVTLDGQITNFIAANGILKDVLITMKDNYMIIS